MALMRWYRLSTGSIVRTSCFTCHHRDSLRKARALVTNKERSNKAWQTKKNGTSFRN